jgi:hypothetical protein
LDVGAKENSKGFPEKYLNKSRFKIENVWSAICEMYYSK